MIKNLWQNNLLYIKEITDNQLKINKYKLYYAVKPSKQIALPHKCEALKRSKYLIGFK